MREQRIGDWITTYSGGRFYPADPRPSEVRLLDIAHALSYLNRYGGHTRWPYSVAQHSVLVSECVERMGHPTLALCGLLHDAAEGLGLCDLPAPFKRSLGAYNVAEDRVWQHGVAPRFGLPAVLPFVVKAADVQVFVNEAAVLLNGPRWWLDGRWPAPSNQIEIKRWTADEAEQRFLERYFALGGDTDVEWEQGRCRADAN